MPYHIPFEHRRRGCPIYIGFETVPPRPRRGFNGWGLASFAVLGLSVGALAPIALILGLVGLRKRPRTLAAFSTVVSGCITAVMATLVIGAAHHVHERHQRIEHVRMVRHNAEKIAETQILLQRAQEDIDDYAIDHDGHLPSQYEGMMLTVQHQDAWKNELRYDVDQGQCLIRSSGPDQRFDTRDDVLLNVGIASAEAAFESAADVLAEDSAK